MKIVSWNVNGLRSIYQKGFLDFIKREQADIVCLQEIKAHKNDLPQELVTLNGYHSFFNVADKKGYSGVMVYTKNKPNSVIKNLGLKRFDKEGRILELEYLKFILVNVYIPHGGRQKENLNYKLQVYKHIFTKLQKNKERETLIVGDFNIAHNEKDLSRPKHNRNNIMFTPKERDQINTLLKLGFTDSFRQFNDETGNFTWWPYGFNARKRNLGWRIDYAFANHRMSKRLKNAFIYSNIQGSDHCPIGVELSV